MLLGELVQALNTVEINARSLEVEVEGVHNDTRRMKAGDLFVAIRGAEEDGHRYWEEAVRLGASLVVTEQPLRNDVPHVVVPDSRIALAELAACIHGNPARRLCMVGVTGTKGKTTVTHILKSVLDSQTAAKTGLIGTNQILVGNNVLPTDRSTPTTPNAVELHAILHKMAEASCTHCVMEASSHALAQSRVYGIPYAVGCFLNLQHDHLDYHKTMEDYFESKALLFRQSRRKAVFADDPWGQKLWERQRDAYRFAIDSRDADLRAEDIRLLPDCVRFTAAEGGDRAEVCWHTPGGFSVKNALAALALARLLDIPLDAAAEGVTMAKPVAARMERLPCNAPFTVISDYAHTAEAMENVLTTARDFTKGRVITVFGCGGDRDRQKRPLMGEAATRLSDLCYLTSDNPRSEDPDSIIKDILAGAVKPPIINPDRREAIRAALTEAKPGDTVMLCGKGQETYQEIKGVKYPMDEKQIALDILGELYPEERL